LCIAVKERVDNHILWLRNLKTKTYLEDVGGEGTIILTYTSKRMGYDDLKRILP
jgi:hypothetical protein